MDRDLRPTLADPADELCAVAASIPQYGPVLSVVRKPVQLLQATEAFHNFSAASWLFFIAFVMIMIGVLLTAYGSLAGSTGVVSSGAVILIGPIPIILGNGPYSLTIIAMAGILTIFGLVFYLFMRSKVQR